MSICRAEFVVLISFTPFFILKRVIAGQWRTNSQMRYAVFHRASVSMTAIWFRTPFIKQLFADFFPPLLFSYKVCSLCLVEVVSLIAHCFFSKSWSQWNSLQKRRKEGRIVVQIASKTADPLMITRWPWRWLEYITTLVRTRITSFVLTLDYVVSFSDRLSSLSRSHRCISK